MTTLPLTPLLADTTVKSDYLIFLDMLETLNASHTDMRGIHTNFAQRQFKLVAGRDDLSQHPFSSDICCGASYQKNGNQVHVSILAGTSVLILHPAQKTFLLVIYDPSTNQTQKVFGAGGEAIFRLTLLDRIQAEQHFGRQRRMSATTRPEPQRGFLARLLMRLGS